MFTTAEIKEHLTKAFSSLQENVYKGKLTHSEKIQAFQKYFETVYNPMELVQTVCYAAPILKEKFEKRIAKKKFPKAVKPEFKYDLAFECEPPKFPNLPSADFALSFFAPYPDWFTCGNIFNVLKNEQQRPAKRVVATKDTLDSFKGFLHFDLDALRITSPTCEAVERKVVKKENPVVKASSNTAFKPTTSSSQGAPSAKDVAPEKTKKSSKGSGKPPLTPKKRKVPTESIIIVEEDEEETPPTPLKKKQKKNKATVSPCQTNKQTTRCRNQKSPSSFKGNSISALWWRSARAHWEEKPTTPLISTANQSDPSSGMNPSPPPIISGAVQNKGSSTGAQNLEADNSQNEQETSSPSEDGKKDSKQAEEKDSEEKEDSEDTPSNSPPRVTFPLDYTDEDDQDSDEIEGYFQQDEDMSEGEADPEGNQTGTGDVFVKTVPNPTNVRSSTIQTSPISLTEEEKNALKQNDPLKYVRLMMAQRESSSEKSISGTSTHSGASANEASHDELLKQVKKVVFDVDLFEEFKKDVGASFGIKKLIGKINITACPTDIGEALIDIQNLIDQVYAEYRREVDAKAKLQSTEQAQATEFDNALRTSKSSEELAASKKSAQAEFDTYTTSIRLWESHIA
ncbi:uncharacterized protein LOC127102686 [Lathyrus oleraceus]|uniref:uncharacterized protein LOC127102686 n=1 Tax=Pisum sativum TaxID=3888 RepID=UPI0021CEE0AB|nr:uncharacterized protein LOC127102686 [Pisum sativum]